MHLDILALTAIVIAFVTDLATTAFFIVFAASLRARYLPLFVLSAASAATQAISLLAILHLIFHRKLYFIEHRRTYCLAYLLGISVLCAGPLLAAVTLTWIQLRTSKVSFEISGQRASMIGKWAFVVWGISALARGELLLKMALERKRVASENVAELCHSTHDSPQMIEVNRSDPANTAWTSPYHDMRLSTPPLTPETCGSRGSSLSMAVRPITSKTGLMTGHQSLTRNSDKSSLDLSTRDCVFHDDGFDMWDTSNVASHIRENVLQSSPSAVRGERLETIPGSRSPSPAGALDGPFPLVSAPESLQKAPCPEKPYNSSSCSRLSTRKSRSASTSNEDHIHPLFRTSSPVPPPTPTPGTVITATPFAGQILNAHAVRRMRSASLSTSPSPLVRFDSWPGDTNNRGTTPPSQDVTPPTAESIVASKVESTFEGYSRQDYFLQVTEAMEVDRGLEKHQREELHNGM